jgi:hypothetical protein
MFPYESLVSVDISFKFRNPSSHNKLFRESFREFQERTWNAVGCITNIPWGSIVAVSWLCQHHLLLFVRSIPYRTVPVHQEASRCRSHSEDETFQRSGTKEFTSGQLHYPIVSAIFVFV